MNLEKFYDKAYAWILTSGPKLLLAIAIFIIGQWLIRILKKVVRGHMTRRAFDSSLQPFLMSLLFSVLQILLVLTIMQILGIQMTVFAALVGGIGVAAGLALSGTLQNFTSGILILLLKPYRVGDNIIAQGQEGTVQSIQIFYTVLLTYDNRDVIIPNSKLSNELIINLSQEGKRRLDLDFKFPFSADYRQVEKIVNSAFQKNAQHLLPDPAPRMGITTLDGDGYHVAINVWVQPHGFVDTKMDFQVQLLEDLKNGGVKMPGM
ncbi:MAG TPA: mechanosensitive ion channel family protein [Puia sp.]|nr:mechanosensitive ion channel family protein [Puia sp.]